MERKDWKAMSSDDEALYTPGAYGDHRALEPIDELLETRVMSRILDEVLHGVPVEGLGVHNDEERAFARRVREDVQRSLGEAPDETCTSYMAWTLGLNFTSGADFDSGQILV